MQQVTLQVGQTATWTGIRPVTESGAPAKIDTQDQAPVLVNDIGDAVGTVSEVREYTDEATGKVGHEFDMSVQAVTENSVSELTLKVDADNDAGETRLLEEKVIATVLPAEAAAFTFPTPTIN